MAEVKMEDAPKKVRDLVDKGISAIERNNIDFGIDMFKMALDMEPRLLQARMYLRAATVKKFKMSGAAPSPLVLTLKGIGPMLAAQSKLKKDPQEALKKAEELMAINPLHLPFVQVLVKAAKACEMPEVAVQALEVVREHQPDNADVLSILTDLYVEVGDTEKAKAYAQKVMGLKPNDGEALKKFKDICALDTLGRGGWDKAGEKGGYRDLMKDKDEARNLEQQQAAVKSADNLDMLIKNNKDKVKQEPENINYRRALADLYLRAFKFDDALAELEEAQKLCGGADPQVDRAISETHVKRFEHEIKSRKEMGDAAGVEAKEKELAEFRFQDIADRVKRYPNDLQYKFEYGVLLYKREDYTTAIQQFQQAQRNPQRRVRALYYLGLCFKAKKQYDIAREQLEKALSELHIMDDTKKDVLYELGCTCELMGDAEKAVEYFKDIYAVDIGFKDISDRIEKGYSK